ncbi:hypothetical protein BJX64DRAFT_288519 [Aspergillus heterothallicus]
MTSRILIAGATGYIGGSVLRSLLSAKVPPSKIWAIVRSDAQADSLEPLGVNVIQAALTEADAVARIVLDNGIDLIIHTVSSVDHTLAASLLSALKSRKEETGLPVHFIHTSGVSAFADKAGWPHGPAKENDDLYELQAAITTPYPVRETDVAIHKTANEYGVAVYTVVPPLVYGKGTGAGNKISVQIPTLIRAAIANKQVNRFAEDSEWPAVHVADLADYYMLLIQAIINHRPPPSGNAGYYLVSGHALHWNELLSALAKELHSMDLVSSAEISVWPNEEIKTKSLGLPSLFCDIAWNSNASVLSKRHKDLGWQPQWDHERLISEIGKEIDAVLEAGTAVKDLANILSTQS